MLPTCRRMGLVYARQQQVSHCMPCSLLIFKHTCDHIVEKTVRHSKLDAREKLCQVDSLHKHSKSTCTCHAGDLARQRHWRAPLNNVNGSYVER